MEERGTLLNNIAVLCRCLDGIYASHRINKE